MTESQKAPETESDKQTRQMSMDDLRLNVGDELRMQIAGALDNTHYPVRYVGALKGESFITTLPLVEGQVIWMRPAGKYIFRTLAGKYAYAFTTQLIKAHTEPYPYAHFACPKMVQARQVRRSYRLSLRLPVTIQNTEASPVQAALRDLSLNGALLESAAPLGAVGDNLGFELPISLAEVKSQLKLSATIRNSEEVSQRTDKPLIHSGVEFSPLSNDDSLLLHYFIDHQVAERVS